MEESQEAEDKQEKVTSRFLPRLVAVCYIFALASNLLTPIWNPTFFERLGIGNWMLASGFLPESNVWTRTGFSQVWHNPSWLFDISVAYIFREFSGQGLIVAKYVSFFLALAGIGWSFVQLSRNLVVGLFVASLVCAGTFYIGAFDPSLLGWPLLAILFLVAKRSSVHKFSLASVCALLATGSLIGAIDPVAMSFLPLFALYFLLRNVSFRAAIIFWAILVAPVISPYHGAQYLDSVMGLIRQTQHNLLSQGAIASIFDYNWAVMLLLVGCFLASAVRARPAGIDFVFAAMLSLIATADSNFVAIALLFIGLLYSSYWGTHIQGLQFIPGVVEAFRRLEAMLSRLRQYATGFSWLLLCISFVNVYGMRFSPIAEAYYPDEQLIQAIKRINSGVLLHDLEIGSFLIYKRSLEMDAEDDATLPLASRQFPFQQAAVAGAKTSMEIEFWQAQISRKDVSTAVCQRGSTLATLLAYNPNWSEADLQIGGQGSQSLSWLLFVKK